MRGCCLRYRLRVGRIPTHDEGDHQRIFGGAGKPKLPRGRPAAGATPQECFPRRRTRSFTSRPLATTPTTGPASFSRSGRSRPRSMPPALEETSSSARGRTSCLPPLRWRQGCSCHATTATSYAPLAALALKSTSSARFWVFPCVIVALCRVVLITVPENLPRARLAARESTRRSGVSVLCPRYWASDGRPTEAGDRCHAGGG